MRSYDLDSRVDSVYSLPPHTGSKPLIGLTGNFADGECRLMDRYYDMVHRAGGVPIIIPPIACTATIINTLDHIDGLLFTGGGDINPLWMGEEPSPLLHSINARRDEAELLTARLAYDRQLPMLGICRGMQTLAAALGGTVAQDIGSGGLKHSQDADRSEATHSVAIAPSSTLYNIYGTEQLAVNSFHHQAVLSGGERFRLVATASDGVVEAMESSEHKAIIGVQWHPEWLTDHLPLFQWLTAEASLFREAKQLHQQTITLDSHCDTPMLFAQGIDFGRREERYCVDLHKMTDGRLDATTMVAYLPQAFYEQMAAQRARGEAAFDGTPKAYADHVFDTIEGFIHRYNHHIALARTADDILRNKQQSKRSILLGIENGLALDHDTSNVKHFAQRGVTYITLCHNGDNDICDSARGTQTWGGVSEFGTEVIREMNRHGLLVDLSHAAESSFYDALAISQTPIVCSHSNCRSLCDHPRNLTDNQMRALAQRGGVMQLTLYHGFIAAAQTDHSNGQGLGNSMSGTAGDSLFDTFFRHLEHAINIMGIDHVGLGTDFDGDGGIVGLAHAGELTQFTTQLLRRGYTHHDIAKIWGGNWLRLLHEAQRSAKP